MSVIEKLENYWRGVCDPRYSSSNNSGHHPCNPSSSLLHGKFDRTSRRCQSSLNIHSHAHQNYNQPQQQTSPQHHHHQALIVSKQNNNSSQQLRKLHTSPFNHGSSFINLPSSCRLCDSQSSQPQPQQPSQNFINPNPHHLPPKSNRLPFRKSSLPLQQQHQHNHLNNQKQHGYQPNCTSSNCNIPSNSGQPQEYQIRDREDIETLLDVIEDKKSTCPDPEPNQPSQYESVKMRLQKPEGRPKSLEFSQRKAWIRIYRDMEVADAVETADSKLVNKTKDCTNSNKNLSNVVSEIKLNPFSKDKDKEKKKNSKKGRSKSILHLHRLDSQPDILNQGQDNDKDSISNNSDDSQCSSLKQQSSTSSTSSAASSSSTTTSLFQRFSKTFSLRFGSNSPYSRGKKANKNQKVKYPVGSSPDLFHRVENENPKITDSVPTSGWKWRQSSSLSSEREEKCRSGDSGISIVEGPTFRSQSTRRARRVQSENIEAILEAHDSHSHSNPAPTSTSPLLLTRHMNSPINRKLSLVEIPDHVWDQGKNNQRIRNIDDEGDDTDNEMDKRNLSPRSRLHLNKNNNNEFTTKSFDDLLETKLDDDGFVSSDESQETISSTNSNNNNSSDSENLMKSSSNNSKTDTDNMNSANKENEHVNPIDIANNNSSGNTNLNNIKQGGVTKSNNKSILGVVQLDLNGKNAGGIRGKVVSEIIQTEQNYVKTLNDIVQGFVIPAKGRKDLFSSRVIENIFCNIEDILRLHARFLEALVSSLDKDNLADSSVGHIFTLWTDEFDLYCDYCCNNPISMLTIQNITTNPVYSEFFEACRRLQMMNELPLHGFLLRPIQRICQYHLQLNELLKQTELDHKDFDSTHEALEAMKKVAQKVNDTQKQFDQLQEIIKVQNVIDLFEGPQLVDKNSRIIHRGDIFKAHQGRKQKEVYVVVFSHELVICRRVQKDASKKNALFFLGRVDLTHKIWHDIDNNVEDEVFGFVQNSWRIYSKEKSCWILFSTVTPGEKKLWLTALEEVWTSSSACSLDNKIELKMRERVKALQLEKAQADLLAQGQLPSQHHSQNSYQNNTLPKSKKTKAKHQQQQQQPNNNKSNNNISDAMLIEVGKLKQSNFSSSTSSSQRDRTSTFYV